MKQAGEGKEQESWDLRAVGSWAAHCGWSLEGTAPRRKSFLTSIEGENSSLASGLPPPPCWVSRDPQGHLKSPGHPVLFELTLLAQHGPYSGPQPLVVDERCWGSGACLSSGPGREPASGLGLQRLPLLAAQWAMRVEWRGRPLLTNDRRVSYLLSASVTFSKPNTPGLQRNLTGLWVGSCRVCSERVSRVEGRLGLIPPGPVQRANTPALASKCIL